MTYAPKVTYAPGVWRRGIAAGFKEGTQAERDRICAMLRSLSDHKVAKIIEIACLVNCPRGTCLDKGFCELGVADTEIRDLQGQLTVLADLIESGES